MIKFLINFHYFLSFFVCLYLIVISRNKFNFTFISILILSLFFIQAIILSYLQYLTFINNSLSKYLLPPYQSLNYFLSYVFYHYFKDLYFRILGSLINLILVIVLNFLFKKTLFYDEEHKLIFISSLLISYPFNILLVPIGLIIILIIHIKNLFFSKNLIFSKISIKNYWLFICFFIIILNIFFVNNSKLKEIILNFTP